MTSPDTSTRPALQGPLGLTGRAPAPDLARGFMLLLIALANTVFYLWGRDRSDASLHPVDGSVADQVVQAVLITAVDLRVYPMFAFLFGYGLMMVYLRQARHGAGEPHAFRLLQRRNLWLVGFGAVHALLLWGGDVLGAYGVCGLLLVWLFLRRSDRTLLVWAGIGTLLLTALAALSVLEAWGVLAGEVDAVSGGLPDSIHASADEVDVLAAAGARAVMWPVQTVVVQGPVGMVVPVSILLGFWAARRRILERPANHRRLLWVTAVGGITVGWAGGLVHAAAHVGLIGGLEAVMPVFATTQLVTGLACGLGYVALFGLLGDRLGARPLGAVGRATSAVGKRSLTCYLSQSMLCAPVLAAWGLGWGQWLGSALMAAYAVVVWAVTVALAVALERGGRRGPAEDLLRRLSYRTPQERRQSLPTPGPQPAGH